MDAGGGQADHASPGCTAEPSTISSRATVPKQAPETSTPRTMLAELGQLAAGDLDPGQLRPAGQPDADSLADLRVGAVDRDVVEHRQRLGADADHVVDVHRHAVDPDRVEAAQLLGDQQLGPDPVGRERDPGPLVELDHARVVPGQRHLPRGPAELDRPPAPSPARRPRSPRPPGRPRPWRRRRCSRRRFFQALRQDRGPARMMYSRPTLRRSHQQSTIGEIRKVGAGGLVGHPMSSRRGCQRSRAASGCLNGVGEQRELPTIEIRRRLEADRSIVPHFRDLALEVACACPRSPVRSPRAGG